MRRFDRPLPRYAVGLASLVAVQAATVCSPPALAQQVLEEIVIEGATLDGAPADPSTLGSSTSVITSEEMERRQIRNAADALRTVPGLIVGQTGSVGGLTQVRIRGGEGNQVKVIIDGVDVRSVEAGEFDFSTLLAADIERIEVIRGPQSGIYGANALSGVINIVTKKGRRGTRASVTAEGGSMRSSYFAMNASTGSDTGYVSLSAARRKTDGFNIARTGSEKDGSTKETIFTRFRFTPTKYFRIGGMGRLQSNFGELDRGDPTDTIGASDERKQQLGSVFAELDTFGTRWKHKVFVDYLDDKYTSVTAGSPFSPFTSFGTRSRYGYLSTLNFSSQALFDAKHTIVGLAERVMETAEFSTETRTAKRSQEGYALEYRGEFAKRFYLTSNIRYDDKDAFDDATTYKVSAAYRFARTGTRLHASYGKGITDPTFFELFGRTTDFVGNPDLKPEESIGWDIGVEQKLFDQRLTVDVTYFQSRLVDKLAGFSFGGFTSVTNLAGTSRRRGVEVAASANLTSNLSLQGAYTYTDATDPDGVAEVRRPKHAGSLGVTYGFHEGRGKVSANAIYNGKMTDLCFSSLCGFTTPARIDDYVVVNVAASYKLNEQWEMFGRVENLFNEKYEEAFGFSAAPVAAYAGFKVSLGGGN